MRHGFENTLLNSACSITRAQERELVIAYKSGDNEAGGRLVQSQVAWVLKLLRRLRLPPQVEFDDMISELSLVLLKALYKFDPDRSALTTYVKRIVYRRAPRIARRLIGGKTAGDDDLESAPQPDNSARLEMIREFDEAVRQSNQTPVAKRAMELSLSGLKPEAIKNILIQEYAINHATNVGKMIGNFMAFMREHYRVAGYHVPPQKTNAQMELTLHDGLLNAS